MRPGVRCIVVTPAGAENPLTGGGQRSRLFFDACVASGPTELVVYGGNPDKDWLAEHFPGAAAIHVIPDVEGMGLAKSPLARKLTALRVLLFPAAGFAPSDDFRRRLEALAPAGGPADGPADGPVVFLFRYAPGFCRSGLAADPAKGRFVVVDVDDRDDQKYASRLTGLVGATLTRALLAPTLIRGVAERIRGALSRASLVFFAADEDVWPLDGARAAVVQNVAAPNPAAETTPPASSGTDVLFVGSYGHAPNRRGVQWFLKHCWPRISAACPEARLRVVGLGRWQDLAPQAEGLERVDLVGTVDALGPEYARARLTICPIDDGGGSKIKVIESGAFARPMVVAEHSARGFAPGFVNALHVADGAEAFAAECIALLNDPQEADRAGALLKQAHDRDYARAAVVDRIRTEIAGAVAAA